MIPFTLLKFWRLSRRGEPLTAAERDDAVAIVGSLERAKDLLAVARLLAYVRPLEPMPGWYFGIFDTSTEPAVVLRKIIWDECFRRKLELPLVFPWHRGSRINLRLGNDMSHPTYLGGCIEPNEFALFDRLLESGMTVVDIGANDGFYTSLAAAKVGAGGRVISFEPSPREFERLTANVALNRFENVETVRKGVAERAGTASFKIAGYEHEGQNTLGDFVWDVRESTEETIELTTLDEELAGRNLTRLDVIKIDIEGAELRALRGAVETLKKWRPVMLLEMLEKAMAHQGCTGDELIEFLKGADYEILGYSDETGLPAAWDRERDENILAVPAGSVGNYVR